MYCRMNHNRNSEYKYIKEYFMKRISGFIAIILISTFIFCSCKKDGESILSDGNDKFLHNDYSGALLDLNKVIELHPNNTVALHNRGLVKYMLKDYIGAIQDYNEALAFNPNSVIEYCPRGNAKMKLGDYLGAIQDYNKSIDVIPIFSEAYFRRAVVKDILKDYEGAQKDYDKFREMSPEDITTYFNMGREQYYYSKDRLVAIHYFDFAIDMNPRDDSSYFYRGNSKLNLGDKSGACLDWKKAGELGIAKAKDLINQYCK
jgi:tetratricopeptide (TPR) repeat protein